MAKISHTAETNDKIRQAGDFGPGTQNPLHVTPGVQALGDDAIAALYTDIMTYNQFTPDIDPSGQHDLGVLHFGDVEVWFKIDPGSAPDSRVFTLLLPEEY